MIDLSLVEQKRLWEGLKLHPAWELLMEMAKTQVVTRQDAVCEPMQPGQEYDREFMKGEICGINTFMALIDTTISVLEYEIEQVNKEPGNA